MRILGFFIDRNCYKISINPLLIQRYYKRVKTLLYIESVSRRRTSGIPWRKQMLKFNFIDGMFNIHLHNSFMKTSSHMFILSLQGISQCTSRETADKGKVADPVLQQGEKISELTAMKSRLCVWFFEGKRIMYDCPSCPLSQQGK